MARIIHEGNTVPLTIDDLKAMKPGDVFYFVMKDKTLTLRVNGQSKTWSTRPDEVKVPWKHGLYDYGYVTNLDVTINKQYRRLA